MSETQQETATALENLATITTSDWTAFITLMTNNANLARQITTLTTHLVTSQGKITNLTAQLAAKGGGSRDCNNNSNTLTGNFPGLDHKGYCWLHGRKFRKGPSSSTCSKQNTGHDATKNQENTEGGSDYNKGWKGE